MTSTHRKRERVIVPSMSRRTFLQAGLGAGVLVVGLGGANYALADLEAMNRARATIRPDGRSRLPRHQYLIRKLKPMGGSAGDAAPGNFRLKVHGEVEAPFTLSFKDLLAMPQTELTCDVHCVTRWTVLDAQFTGVLLKDLAERARVKKTARHVIFEAAQGYTSNVRLREALAPNVMVAHKHQGKSLSLSHGAPVRAVIPDLYFWKSAKWLTGIRFSARDEPGYWEVRGYHNHGDPWKEERHG
jgi:DMSO/TMAO reductase YedYZ molybdopterin-dependent catalytic subunit